jgi:hypothetical protein
LLCFAKRCANDRLRLDQVVVVTALVLLRFATTAVIALGVSAPL